MQSESGIHACNIIPVMLLRDSRDVFWRTRQRAMSRRVPSHLDCSGLS